jgi:hypothetical protein
MVIGGILSAAILLVAFGIMPLVREWRRLGDILTPRMENLGRLEVLAQRQKLLRARRDALAAGIGLVAGPEALAKPEPAAAGEKSGAPGSSKPDTGPKEKLPPTAAAPDSAPVAVGPAAPDSAPVAASGPANARVDTGPAAGGDPPASKAGSPAAKAGPPSRKGGPPGPQAESGPISLATYVDRLTKKSGIGLVRLTPRKVRAGSAQRFFAPAAVRISFQADLQSLLKFLQAIDGSERLIRVEEVEFSRDEKSGPMLQVTMEISGYEVKS